MAAIGSTWASGSWVSVGGWAAGTWADAAASSISRIDDDTGTAFAIALRSIPAGPGGITERLRAYLNTQYGTSNTDIAPLLARYLRDIKQ
jgi:hypothetical protein